jgi:hypothetical protein
VIVAAGSLVRRLRRAHGIERLQLRWVASAAVLVALAGVIILAALALGVPGATILLGWAVGVCLAVLPVATGAAILRYRLDTLTGELLVVVDQTMQPTRASLWRRPHDRHSASATPFTPAG